MLTDTNGTRAACDHGKQHDVAGRKLRQPADDWLERSNNDCERQAVLARHHRLVVVYAYWLCIGESSRIAFEGNNQLVDIGYVLDIQQLAASGTLVANNSQLCFDAALSWSHRSDSHLEYNVGQVCDVSSRTCKDVFPCFLFFACFPRLAFTLSFLGSTPYFAVPYSWMSVV